jgi:hypothetical protein
MKTVQERMWKAFADAGTGSHLRNAVNRNAPANPALIPLMTFGYTYSHVLTNTDPGSGNLSFDNADPALASRININKNPILGQSLGISLADSALAGGNSKLFLDIKELSNPGPDWNYTIGSTSGSVGSAYSWNILSGSGGGTMSSKTADLIVNIVIMPL